MSGTTMRGLTTFITDIRGCKSKDQEQSRVEKELAKIREKFLSMSGLNGYQRKKYVWKLLYMYILGYEINFGHQESANLINSGKFTEKYTGYIATGILINENDSEIHKTIANAIRFDINGQNEINQSLAISMIGALAPKELVEQLDRDIQKIAFNVGEVKYPAFVRKKAVLCLLRMFRKYPERYNPSKWTNNILSLFDSSRNQLQLGYLSASCSFLLGISQYIDPAPFSELTARIVKYLQKLAINRDCSQDYLYYSIPNPWLQVKLLRILQLFPMSKDATVQKVLTELLKRIIKKTEVGRSVNKNNANHSILFEAANLIIHYGKTEDISEILKDDIIKLLGIFISVREPNLKYLGLETMCKFSQFNNQALIDKHLQTILKSLKGNDISIKKRALDLLYLMCTQQSSKRIVEELLSYSEDWADSSIKEELVLKIAILAERYAEDMLWYVDVVVRLAGSCGDFVTDDIWHRIIQMITGFGKEKEQNRQLQKYAANKLYVSVNLPHVHPTLLMIGAFVIAEFAEYLVESGKDEQKLFDILHRHFQNSDEKVRCMLLNSFAKLASKYPDLSDQALMVFEVCSEHFDPDLQQRGIEYNAIMQKDLQFQQKIFARQPTYSEDIQNSNPLLKKIYKLKLGNMKHNKDPTVQKQIQQQAKESVEQFIHKGETASKDSKSAIPTKPLKEHINHLKEQILFDFCPGKFLTEGKGVVSPYTDLIESKFVNFNECKALLSKDVGVLVNDSGIQINYKSEYKEHMGQIAIQIVSSQGKLENVSLMVTCKDHQGMDFNISPVNYSAEHPTMIVQIMSVESIQGLPVAQLFYDIQNGDKKKKLEFKLPVLQNKFVQPVNMPPEQFDNFFNKYSDITTDAFYKLDAIIKNPAPDNVPLTEVMKKAGAMFTTCFNLKVMAVPDMSSIQSLNCVGQFFYKDKGELIKYPIMVQMECKEDFREQLRVSYRGGNPHVLQTFNQLTTLLFAPHA